MAKERGTRVEKADALDWLVKKLAARPEGQLTIIYHSVFLIYPPREVIGAIMAAIAEAGERATPSRPLAWLCFESEALFGGAKQSPSMLTRLQVWPEGEARVLNRSDGHATQILAP